MNGLLVINKQQGVTSHDVVNDIRHIFKTKQVGHLGTWDPLATGVLVICIGDATKLVQFLENVNNSKPHLEDDPILDIIIYGKDGLVDKLKPYQNQYNIIKNRMYDYIRRCSEAMVIVEDGSIDVDSLEEEGLAPGKILVYRQGANTPTTETEAFNNYLYEAMKEQCQYLEVQMHNVIYYFCKDLDNIIDEVIKDETNNEE